MRKVFIVVERDYIGSSILGVFEDDDEAYDWVNANHSLNKTVEEHDIIKKEKECVTSP